MIASVSFSPNSAIGAIVGLETMSGMPPFANGTILPTAKMFPFALPVAPAIGLKPRPDRLRPPEKKALKAFHQRLDDRQLDDHLLDCANDLVCHIGGGLAGCLGASRKIRQIVRRRALDRA